MLCEKPRFPPMSADRWEQLWRLFHEALELEPQERLRFLDQQANENPGLEAELRSLLAAHEQQHTVLDRPPLGPPPMEPGARIGPWRLVRELGVGGMGVVWQAERADGAYEQTVALKLLAPGRFSPTLTARFHRERQILARLSHPNIAALLDGGTSDDGHPYLVMEYIEGVPLTDYIRQRDPGVGDRLTLFVRICDAVDHAHRHLVLHRDLKPANILVTADGSPKLLDFGIGRLLEPDTDEQLTRPAERQLTPEYASPEQLAGEAVGTGSDCFSLGVILFELLTGQRPWKLDGLGAQKALAVIESDRAPLPSRIAHADEGRARAAQLRGDLDRICVKALHPDPKQRYTSAREIARDIECHRRGLPIGARPDSWRYRTGKFLGRHRAAVAASGLAASLLVALTVALGLESARLADALDQARQQTQRAEALGGFLSDLFSEADPQQHGGSPRTARDLLAHGTERINRSFDGQPGLRAALLTSLGRIYTHLGEFDRAERLLTEAVAALESRPEPDPRLRAQAELALGQLLQETRRNERAEAAARRALTWLEQGGGEAGQDRLKAHLLLATALQFQGELDAADRIMDEIAGGETVPAGALAGEIALRRGALAWSRGNFAEAGEHYRAASEVFSDHFGPRHAKVARARNAVAAAAYRMGRFDAAESAYRETLEIREAIYGPDHPETAETLAHLGALLYDRGKIGEALSLMRRALSAQRAAHGAESPVVANTLNNIALALSDLGRFEEAEARFREALRIHRATHDMPHASVAGNLSNLGLLYIEQGRFQEARQPLEEALSMQRELYPDGHPATAFTLNHLGRAALGLGHHDRARERLGEALALRRRLLEAGHPRIADTLFWRGRLDLATGRLDDAVDSLRKAADIRRAKLGADDPRTIEATGLFGVALLRNGEAERGRAMAQESVSRLANDPDRRQRVTRALRTAR